MKQGLKTVLTDLKLIIDVGTRLPPEGPDAEGNTHPELDEFRTMLAEEVVDLIDSYVASMKKLAAEKAAYEASKAKP